MLRNNIGQHFVSLICLGIGVICHEDLVLIVEQDIALVLIIKDVGCFSCIPRLDGNPMENLWQILISHVLLYSFCCHDASERSPNSCCVKVNLTLFAKCPYQYLLKIEGLNAHSQPYYMGTCTSATTSRL